MSGMVSQLHTTRGFSRVKASGLRIKTNTASIADASASSGKSKAIASADWRSTASAPPSASHPKSFLSSRRNKDSSQYTSESSAGTVVVTEEVESKTEQRTAQCVRSYVHHAPWDMVNSAPVGESSPPPSLPRSSNSETLDVLFKNVKPMIVKVSGEDIKLPNRFTFEVAPVTCNLPGEQSWMTVGKLKRVRSSSRLSRMSFDELMSTSDELPEDLQKYMSDTGSSSFVDISPVTSEDSKGTGDRRSVRIMSSDSGVDITSHKDVETPKSAEKPPASESQRRFQGLLNRLQKRSSSPPPLPPRKSSTTVTDVRAVDPAIVAAKVKDSGSSQRRPTPLAERMSDHVWVTGSVGSSDSGYATGNSMKLSSHSSGSSQGLKDSSESDHASKKLNPAAAEFKTAAKTVILPVLSPAKHARTPVSHVFPRDDPKAQAPPATPMTRQNPPVDLGRSVPSIPVAPKNGMPISNVNPPLFGFNPAGMATIPGTLPPLNFRQGQPPFPAAAPILPSGLPMPNLNNFGTFPPPHMNNLTMEYPQLFPHMRGLPQLGPPAGTLGGPFAPPVNDLLNGNYPAASLPFRQFAAQHTPFVPPKPPVTNFGPKGEIIRPHFPVTQKPRDHDPIKQQQYEAYLEWRKANEPGYHMKCKIRQANRVVRQHQQRQQSQNPAPNPQPTQPQVQAEAPKPQQKDENGNES